MRRDYLFIASSQKSEYEKFVASPDKCFLVPQDFHSPQSNTKNQPDSPSLEMCWSDLEFWFGIISLARGVSVCAPRAPSLPFRKTFRSEQLDRCSARAQRRSSVRDIVILVWMNFRKISKSAGPVCR